MTTIARDDVREARIPDRRRPSVPPRTTDWAARAVQVATRLSARPAVSDRPLALVERVALLKEAGFVTLPARATHGGTGHHWATVYRVLRQLAAADALLARSCR